MQVKPYQHLPDLSGVPPSLARPLKSLRSHQLFVKGRLKGNGLAGETFKPTKLPLKFEATRSKTMKNVKSIIWSTMLVLAISAPTFAKGGTISTTRTGTISTTRTGTISTTAAGTISTTRAGTISTTRTGTISTTRAGSIVNIQRAWLFELLLTIY